MYIVFTIVSILLVIFFFLYIQLRRDVTSLNQQLKYTKEEESSFTLFESSSKKEMRHIIKTINIIKGEIDDIQKKYMHNEKDIQEMITNISHDIRTPLTSIQGYVEMIQQSDNPSEKERYYNIVMNRLHDLESMLDEFFLYTKLKSSREPCIVEEKEIYPIVCQTLLNYMEVLKEHDLNPIVICDEEGLLANIHEDYVKRICVNLIINTMRYGSNPFRIEIKKIEKNIQVIFENKCLKNVEIDIDHLFDRFYKGDQARNQKGSGLGLAIVKELSERMNGSVCAHCEGHILRITLTVPMR